MGEGTGLEQRESMGTGHAAAAEVSGIMARIEAQRDVAIEALRADAAQKRWRAFASKVAAARRPRSVAAQRILQGLAPVGRVVVHARSTAQRVDVVRAALGASDAWARGAGDRGASSVWAAHGAADNAVQLCASASKRNAKRAVEAREALASQSADAAPGSDAITRAKVAWPPPTVAAGKGAFAEVRWMEEPAQQALVPSQEVAWSRVLRELGVDPAAAKAALAVEHYKEAAGVEKPTEPEPAAEEARPEKRFALGLSAWAEFVSRQLKEKDGSTFEAVVAKAFEDAKAGLKKTEYSGLRLPTEMIDDFTSEYVLSFSSVGLEPNVDPANNQPTLQGALLHCRLQDKNAAARVIDAGRRLVGGGQRVKVTALLDRDLDKQFDKDGVLSMTRTALPTIASNVVHRMLLAGARDRRLEIVRKAVADAKTSWPQVLALRRLPVARTEKEGKGFFSRARSRKEQLTDASRSKAIATARANLAAEEGSEGSDMDEGPESDSDEEKQDVVDMARLGDAYLLYLYSGGGAMPKFFPEDQVVAFHEFGAKEISRTEYDYDRKWGGGDKKREGNFGDRVRDGKQIKSSARDCRGRIIAWTDALYARTVKNIAASGRKNVRDSSPYEYLVEIETVEIENTTIKGVDANGKMHVVDYIEGVEHTTKHRALVLESALRLQDDKAPTGSTFLNWVTKELDASDESRTLSRLQAAFSVPGFAGAYVHDVFQWLKVALRRMKAGAVELLLKVELLEDGEDVARTGEKDAERQLALRTDLVGNALRYAIRQGETRGTGEASVGLRSVRMILAVGGAKSFVRLVDLRVLLEKVFTLASRNNRIATTEIFEELLKVYADGEALETWTLSGTTRPLIHSIFERARLEDSIQSRLLCALMSRLAELGRVAVPASERLWPHGLTAWHTVLAQGDEALAKSAAETVADQLPTDDYGRSPLVYAAQTSRSLGVVRALARRVPPAHLAKADVFGCNALHYAARTGKLPICRLLAAEFADRAPGMLSVSSSRRSFVGIHTGALDYENYAGESPLGSAAASSVPNRVAVCAKLIEAGARVSRAAAFDLLVVPEHASLRGWEGVEPALLAARARGMPVHALVAADRVEAVSERLATAAPEFVVRAHHVAREVLATGGGASGDVGATALHVARSGEMARLLLGVQPNAWRRRTYHGDTPLHRACLRDDAEVVEALLAGGARYGRAFLNQRGESVYEIATGESKRLIRAFIARREEERRRLDDEASRQKRSTNWVEEADKVDVAGKLKLIKDRVAVLAPPQDEAYGQAIDAGDGASVLTRSEGTTFNPSIPVYLAPEALAQLFQIDGVSRRRAVATLETVAVDGVPPGATRHEGHRRLLDLSSLRLYTSADDAVVFEQAFDYVDGARTHQRVLRVYALDARGDEAAQVLDRISKLHREGRASPLAYELTSEPGKGQAYYKLPDPISATGVCKFFRLTRTLIDIAASNAFLGPPRGVQSDFELDHEETDQVCKWSRDPTPTLLLGRGGTGKTLIILQSLWKKYQLAAEEGEGGVVVFVTGSNVLRNSVREAFISLRHAYLGIAQDDSDAPPASLRREDLGTSDGRPKLIFYTTKELLAAVDASCTQSLLSGDQREATAAMTLEESLRQHEATAEVATEQATTEITERDFMHWWRRGTLGKGIRTDPGVVWSEILTHIKGSPRASARGRPLSRKEYLDLPRKTAPAFYGLGSAGSEKWGNRDAVYDCFERYEEEKRKLGGYDVCDLVTSCMTQQLGGSYEGVNLASLICDEVQDFTLSTVVLLLNLLENEDEFMCGGDTAQTICKVTFSFKDLREVLYRRRLRAAKRLEEHWATAPENRGPDAPAVPRQNQLRVLRTNYRCHQGVLSVANLCLDMMMRLFPDSVDAIAAEQAHFAGTMPLLFLDDKFDEVADVFLGRGTVSTEFGANQVIIVRNQEAKRSLPKQLAGALVMTPGEAKGMEFKDVIVYNFFKDSEASDRAWGAGAREIVGVALSDSQAAAFDSRQHLVLADELKQLYVACTRAQERLVFFDEGTAREAFFRSLLHRRIARKHDGVFSPTDGAVALARASEALEWRKRGNELLARAGDGDFTLASDCFAKSGDEPRRLLCIGRATLSQARSTHDVAARRALALTASYLLARSECEGSEVPLAEALEECGEHGVAADAWRRLGRENDAFRASREHLRATDPEAHAAWKADADAAARAALAAKRALQAKAAPSKPRRPRAAVTASADGGIARQLLDKKIENAATARPRRADTSSEAAAPPSVASKVSRATSAATSAIAVAPSAHARERMVEREIARRDLQEAKKYGARRSMQGGRVSYEFRGLKYIEAPGRSAVGVTAFYKTVPDGFCERAFVPYGYSGKKAPRRDVDRLVQAILRDRGVDIDVSEHSEKGEFGYLVASRTSQATDEAADGLRKLLSAGRVSSPVTGLPTVSEDSPAAAFPMLPVREEPITEASFPPLPTGPRAAAERLAARRLELLQASEEELRREQVKLVQSEQSRRITENKLMLSDEKLATTKKQLERATASGRATLTRLRETEEALRAAETARDDLEVELATARSDRPAESDKRMTQKLAAAEKARRAADKRLAQSESARRDSEATLRRSLNAALAAVADRDRALAARERELRDLRSAQLPPEPVPLRDLSEIADPVESFLEAVGLGHHLAIFKREEIDIDTLRDIDTGDLEYLGLSDDECRRFEDARNANF